MPPRIKTNTTTEKTSRSPDISMIARSRSGPWPLEARMARFSAPKYVKTIQSLTDMRRSQLRTERGAADTWAREEYCSGPLKAFSVFAVMTGLRTT
jgi:hypothetical protein